jgi:hypothetical protein
MFGQLTTKLGAANVMQGVCMLITAVSCLMLAHQVPGKVAGIITGSTIGQKGTSVGIRSLMGV